MNKDIIATLDRESDLTKKDLAGNVIDSGVDGLGGGCLIVQQM